MAKTTTAKPRKPATPKKDTSPSLEHFLEEVKQHAYQLYRRRLEKNLPGDELTDWLEAEKEVRGKYSL